MSEKVAYKPGLDYFLKCFLPITFGRLISVMPGNFQKFLQLGGPAAVSSPIPPARTPMQVAGERRSLGVIRTYRLENACFLSACPCLPDLDYSCKKESYLRMFEASCLLKGFT